MVSSDEEKWVSANLTPRASLPNVEHTFRWYNNIGARRMFFANEDTTEAIAFDLAVMASCHHSVYDYGTFGFWGAWMAGGQTILARTFADTDKVDTKTIMPLEKSGLIGNKFHFLTQW